jgi:tetratricopeptide (TPR) repeat protein
LKRKKDTEMEKLKKGDLEAKDPEKYKEELNRLQSYKVGFRFKRDYALLRVRCNDIERLEMDNADARFSFNISTGLALIVLGFAAYLFLPVSTTEQFNVGPHDITKSLISILIILVSVILFASAIFGDFYNVHVPVIMELFKKYDIPCPYCPAHSLLPELIEVHIKKAHADKEKTYMNAIEIYGQLLEANQNDADAFNNMGLAHVLLQRYEDSIPYFDKAIVLNPHHLQSRINKAISLGLLGRKDESESSFNDAKCLI